jgi:hypothetical protein
MAWTDLGLMRWQFLIEAEHDDEQSVVSPIYTS